MIWSSASHRRWSRRMVCRFMAVFLVGILLTAAACAWSGAKNCQSDADCPAQQRCESAGGVIFGGERVCVGASSAPGEDSGMGDTGDGGATPGDVDSGPGDAGPADADATPPEDIGSDADTGCDAASCQAPTCDDGLANGDESDIDCGGSCQGCAEGSTCRGSEDCASGLCDNGICQSNPLVTVWKTDHPGLSEADQVRLPLRGSGTYDFEVDWGDGTTDTITSSDQAETTHTYAAAGTYTVEITGQIEGWYVFFHGDAEKLVEIRRWGPLVLGGGGGYFQGATNMEITATDVPDLSQTTTMREAFSDCESLTTVPSLNEWDVSQVTDMRWMFQRAASFNQDIGDWDTSNVQYMNAMFLGASSFDQDISGWDLSSATTLAGMFRDASSFDQDLGAWDVTNVRNMDFMFENVTLSTANYDSLLIGWAGQQVRSGVEFHAGDSQYSSGAAASARQTLADFPHNWVITDGGQAP